MLVRHKPQWHRHCRRGSAVTPPWSQWFRSGSVIDRRSTAENCQHRGPSRWHGGNFEHVQNFRSSTAGWANVRIAAAPPLPPQHRRDTAMTAVAPYKDRSSTSITAVHPQYNRRAIAKNRLATLRRSRGVSTAVTAVLPRCYHLTGLVVLPPTPQLSANDRRSTAIKAQL